MATISKDAVEAEARRLLREQIKRSPWFQNGMAQSERRKRIEQDVDAWWHLKADEAAQSLGASEGVETALRAARETPLPEPARPAEG